MTKRMMQGVFAGLILWLGSGLTASAQNISNQATQMTFQQPVEIPGQILQPGTYWFTVLDEGVSSGTNRVQIKNADANQVVATLVTETADQAQFGQETKSQGVNWPNGKVVIRVAENGPNEPIALVDWYYPGNTAGHRFVYPTKWQKELDEAKHDTLAFNPGDKITIGNSDAAFK